MATTVNSVTTSEDRLAEGAERLAGARPSIFAHPRLLVTAAATLMSAGVLAVGLGWYGASRSTLVEEQVPYLISGGLLGVALATIGALLFFTHWLTVAVKEARRHEAARRDDHLELLAAVRALAPEGGVDGNARGARSGRQVRRSPRSS
jgi:hypothetical protein